MKGLLVFLLLCVACLRARAQQYPLRNYNIRDGLAHPNVYRIFQDRRGFIWCATDHGLSRFDGASFHNYREEDGLTKRTVMSVSEDEQGTKLIATHGGGLDVMTDSAITRLRVASGTMPDYILFARRYRGDIWFVDGWYRRLYRIRKGTLEHIAVKDRTGTAVSFGKMVLVGTSLLFASRSGVYGLDESGQPQPLWPVLGPEEAVDVAGRSIDDCWLGLAGRLVHMRAGQVVREYPFTGPYRVSCLMMDRPGRVWMGTTGAGSGVFVATDERIENLSGPVPLPNVLINDLYQDREGNIWIATHGKGIYLLSNVSVVNYAPTNGLLNAYCKSIAPLDSSRLLVTSIGTIAVWDQGRLSPLKTCSLPPAAYIYFCRTTARHIIWGTSDGFFFKERKPPYREVIISRAVYGPSGVISYLEDSKGNTWAGSYSDLYRLRGDYIVPEQHPLIRNTRFNALAEDRRGNIWLGTDSGLIVYNDGRYAPAPIPGDTTTTVAALCVDRRDRLWVATASGLYCRDGGRFISYAGKDGLESCNALMPDTGSDRVWVGDVEGLSAVDLRTMKLHRYRSDDYAGEVLSIYATADRLFLGMVDGLKVLSKKDLVAGNTPPPPLYITMARAEGRPAPMPAALKLPYKNNRLTVDFIGISYRYANSVNYRYRIEGLDETWRYTRNHTLDIPALPSGSYTLAIACRINDGAWSKEARLSILVATPFWQTWWFRMAAFLVLTTIAFTLVRARIQQREARKRRQLAAFSKIAYLKQQALSALINPHFIFNCMNAVQHYLNRNDSDKANEYLADFAALIRMTMEQAQEAFISLRQELARLRLYLSLEQLRFGHDLRYEINVEPGIDTATAFIPNMILQPYVENAIWHGIMPKKAAGCIRVSVQCEDERSLLISIEDDGVGLLHSEAAKEEDLFRKSYGMKLTESRLALLKELLHQRYEVSTGPAYAGHARFPGTLVVIRIPANAQTGDLAALEQHAGLGAGMDL